MNSKDLILASVRQNRPLAIPLPTLTAFPQPESIDLQSAFTTQLKTMGGEAIKITDLAEAIHPGIETHEIGIRPGEKLHECMITSDEALQTVEMDDRYTILPSFMDLSAWKCGVQTTPVGKRMVYSSETNTEWLNANQLTKMIDG